MKKGNEHKKEEKEKEKEKDKENYNQLDYQNIKK